MSDLDPKKGLLSNCDKKKILEKMEEEAKQRGGG